MPDNENEKLYQGTTAIEPPTAVAACDDAYAELDVTTNFSFLRGASHPDELVYTAALLGYQALAITDLNSVAGVARAYDVARKIEGFQLIVGTRLCFNDGTPDLLVWPTDGDAYARLCRLLTRGRLRADKGECHLSLGDFLEFSEGQQAALAPAWPFTDERVCGRLTDVLGDDLSLALSLSYGGDDEDRLDTATRFSRRVGVPLVATNHVHYHEPNRRALQDVLTCVRLGCDVRSAGFKLFPNAERYLKSPRQMHALFAACPEALTRGLEIAGRCKFSLDQLKYEYPTEDVPSGVTSTQHLRDLTYAGAADRYPGGVPEKVVALIKKELGFISHSKYESYFLTVHDLVRYARSQNILCQGRGSAANSAVCYCLGVTAVDPDKFQLVFERFASDARAEPPDIDIDFEHERREEVIQYVYRKYGRDRAGMTASLITYRGRSAVRDVGKVLGFSTDTLDELAGKLEWWDRGTLSDKQLAEAGVDRLDPSIAQLIALTTDLLGFPRHLSQHVGGMVIARRPLCELVPIENAAMADRTVIEWDKDDLDTIGLFKIDLLALGMLTCISKSLVLINQTVPDANYEMHSVPQEDEATYDMICDADTVGVFQIESRAQMSMLPRLRPREFYDLVIEVAIVRPGPIQGQMVHPYLQRREARRADPNYRVEYPKEELREVLGKTLGVPLFQEQAMKLSMVAAGFTGGQADQLRRAMAAWKRGAGLGHFYEDFVGGMTRRGYKQDFAERCFKQICGFGEYGFPESHAASFAKLVYVSCWLKRFHPAAFAAGLLNSQPMGFYAPAQIVRDAREHGVTVRPIDVNHSNWDCTLETDTGTAAGSTGHKSQWGVGGPAVRLGLRMIKGLRVDDARKLVEARSRVVAFTCVAHLQQAAGLSTAALQRLAKADAFASIALKRRNATWATLALSDSPAPLFDGVFDSVSTKSPGLRRTSDLVSGVEEEDALEDDELSDALPAMPERDEVITDYATTSLSLKRHPVAFARAALYRWKVVPTDALKDAKKYPHGKRVSVAGLVLVRQRPGTASGVVFITLEDETGVANLIIWSSVYERYRTAARHATLLQASGTVQREGQVVHVLVSALYDRTEQMSGLNQTSRDFH